jgi:hypothetical protein
MYNFPTHDLWGGIRAATRSEGDELAHTMVDFTDKKEINPEDAYIINYTFGPRAPDVLVAHVIVNTNGVANASAFKEIQKIPVIMDDVKKRSMANMANSYLLPNNQQYVRCSSLLRFIKRTRQVWFSLTFKNDVKIIKKAAVMHDELVDELKSLISVDSFTTQCLFQPMPTLFAARSVERGGNILGLDKVKENALLWLITGSSETPGQHAIMREKLMACSADWQYLNYVDQTQNSLKSYGKQNTDFMFKASAKYDPSGMFQKQVTRAQASAIHNYARLTLKNC